MNFSAIQAKHKNCWIGYGSNEWSCGIPRQQKDPNGHHAAHVAAAIELAEWGDAS